MKKRLFKTVTGLLALLICILPLTSCMYANYYSYYDDDAGDDSYFVNQPPEKDTGAYKLTDKRVGEADVRPHYNLGINKRLEGDIVVVLFYMNDNDSRWTTKSIDEFTKNQIVPVLEFLEKNAEDRGIDLNFTFTEYATAITPGYSFKYDGVVVRDLNNSPTGSTKDLIWHECVTLGYPTYTEMNKYFTDTYNADEVIYLTIINDAGVTYSRNSISEDKPGQDNYPENSIIFARNLKQSDEELAYGERFYSIAFALLCLYGGQNMDKTDGREILSATIYPDDIMYAVYTDYTRFTLEDYTAYCIGWTDEIPDICYYDFWWK